jgi:hypothetical protein
VTAVVRVGGAREHRGHELDCEGRCYRSFRSTLYRVCSMSTFQTATPWIPLSVCCRLDLTAPVAVSYPGPSTLDAFVGGCEGGCRPVDED